MMSEKKKDALYSSQDGYSQKMDVAFERQLGERQ